MSSKKINKLLEDCDNNKRSSTVYQNLSKHFLNTINLFESYTWYSFYTLNKTPTIFLRHPVI